MEKKGQKVTYLFCKKDFYNILFVVPHRNHTQQYNDLQTQKHDTVPNILNSCTCGNKLKKKYNIIHAISL